MVAIDVSHCGDRTTLDAFEASIEQNPRLVLGITERAVAPRAPRGRGSALGRAVQVGCEPATVINDGVAHPRQVPRWTWYRHTQDWLLVRPSGAAGSQRR